MTSRLPQRHSKAELKRRVQGAYERLLRQYTKTGGWRYYGRPNAQDPRGYQGPMFWAEMDGAFRMAVELEKEFPRQVHLEMALNTSTLHDFDKNLDRKQFVDVVVSDLRGFEPDAETALRFARRRHDVFLEVKHFRKGWWKPNLDRALRSVQTDADRLASHVERGHCTIAGALILDDDGKFEARREELTWPRGVEVYVASERTAARLESS